MLCVLFAIVVVLFNIAPITYIVFGIAIVLSLLLQYRRFKKQSISEKKAHSVGLVFVYCLYPQLFLVSKRLVRYDLKTSIEQFDSFEYSTMDWTQGWPNSGELPGGVKRPGKLPDGIYRASAFRSSLAWANAYPERYTVA